MKAWIDTHAHVYSKEFDADRSDMLRRAFEAGVGRILMPNINHTSIDGMMELELKYPDQCLPMMGLHPCSVKQDFEKELYIVESWLSKRKFTALGEMGTDLYWDKTFWPQQQEAFVIQVNWAKKHKLPLVIHSRESIDETIALLAPLTTKELTGVFHCFTGTADQAKQITDMGFYLGIGGVATFKNGGVDKVLPHVLPERIVLETDSPYLAPVPHRGKRNEPHYMLLIAQRVADILGIPMEQLMDQTTGNALKLFRDQTANP
ncbi:MAG: TatD family hydrolase [Cyclobacteriaceae bacterium]|nr:TatD family hydrolase [Cyclobacteriaceae bacterium]